MGTSSGSWILDSTDTVNVDIPWFPASSLAMHVTIVSPIGKKCPGSGVHSGPTVTASLSVAVGMSNSIAAPFATIASTEMFSLVVRDGAIVSPVASVLTTETIKLVVPLFPAASDAVHVTIVSPTGKRSPDGGVHVGPTVTPMLSDIVGVW